MSASILPGPRTFTREYTVCLQHVVGHMIVTVHNVKAWNDVDAVVIAKDHMATPHHWDSFSVMEQV